jgi:hypothetical protein
VGFAGSSRSACWRSFRPAACRRHDRIHRHRPQGGRDDAAEEFQARDRAGIVAEAVFVVLDDGQGSTRKGGGQVEEYGFKLFRLAGGKIADHRDA